ncbi:unnamed protein product [Auanema sp. JU1783]|nr:unnamed protein product [Auanema sp. JU1783]
MTTTFPSYIVDAFTKQPFKGNQAAVCLIPKVLANNEYQTIAAEFNLSETAFPVPLDGDYRTATRFSLRWFTPMVEVPLCGHATLATSHVLFYEIGNVNEKILFTTKSGELVVNKSSNGTVSMNFPQYSIYSLHLEAKQIAGEDAFRIKEGFSFLNDLIDALVPSVISVQAVTYAPDAKKLIITLNQETTRSQLESIVCDPKKLLSTHPSGETIRGVMITVKPTKAKEQGFVDIDGTSYDYASRYFAPWVGIAEDPATGSAQCCLAPYWSKLLQKQTVYAIQCFPNRGAEFEVEIPNSERVVLIGKSQTIVDGRIHI